MTIRTRLLRRACRTAAIGFIGGRVSPFYPLGKGTNSSSCCYWTQYVELEDIGMPAIIMWLLGVPLIVIVLLYLIF
jgi:hypothetical protein